MTEEELEKATQATGRWDYDDGHDKTVRIVSLPYDYWYAVGEADAQLEPDEQPEPLGDEGLLYYPFFAQIDGAGLSHDHPGQGLCSVEGSVGYSLGLNVCFRPIADIKPRVQNCITDAGK